MALKKVITAGTQLLSLWTEYLIILLGAARADNKMFEERILEDEGARKY